MADPTVEDLSVSAAGLRAGKIAFQQFLLAGERASVSGLRRPGEEERAASFIAALPGKAQTQVRAYFDKQSKLSAHQRASLLGPLFNLKVDEPLSTQRMAQLTLDAMNKAEQSELRTLRRDFGVLRGSARAPRLAAQLAPEAVTAAAQAAATPKIAFVDLILDSIFIEDIEDDGFFGNSRDEVTLNVVEMSEVGAVALNHVNLGQMSDGQTQTFNPPKLLATIPVSGVPGFPRTFTFRVDAVEVDDGNYNDALKEGVKLIKEKVTEQLIALGIIKFGEAIGIPIPAPVAAYLASYVKGWFDDFVDWLSGIFNDDDELVGSRSRTVTLVGPNVVLQRHFFLPSTNVTIKALPHLMAPVKWDLDDGDAHWILSVRTRLR